MPERNACAGRAEARGSAPGSVEIERLTTALGFGPEEATRLRAMAPLLEPLARRALARLGEAHGGGPLALASWDESARRVAQGDFGAGFARARVETAVGLAAAGVSLEERLGAYSSFLASAAGPLAARDPERPDEAARDLLALAKLVLLDLALALENGPEEHGHLRRELRERDEQQQRLEEQLRQAQKLEAVGRLAGGAAHDFNNLLTAILGYADTLAERLRAQPEALRDAEEIRKAAQRAGALTQQLLTFSRRQAVATRRVDLNAVVADVHQLLARLIGEDIDLRSFRAPALAPILADPGLLEQVIVNLAVNARDAMPAGGQLTIETRNVELGEGYVGDHAGVAPGPHVLLAVTDTGLGMDRETMSRIFEPFFTTKEPGRGTGLGLSTVYGIVKQFGGHVWVYSEPKQGTTFKIYFPAAEAALPERPAVPQAASRRGRPGGDETILLVEDDDGVRELVRQMLAVFGYRVLTARHAEEALQTSAAHASDIDLLLTDVVLPGLGGRALYERLAPQRPGLRVLYLSGHADEAIVRHGVLDPGTPFLQKPFSVEDLATKIREVLDRPQPA